MHLRGYERKKSSKRVREETCEDAVFESDISGSCIACISLIKRICSKDMYTCSFASP